jgi:hypothetical protein
MKVLKPAEIKSIEQFFQLSQENLLKAMGRYLKSKYETIYITKDYVVAVGDIPVALVAHLDTVFSRVPEDIFYDKQKNVMWSPDGLGADDRAGVYAIVQLLKQGFRPTIIFTTDEERGALGADKLIQDHPTAPTELKYIIELDRRGNNDCVFYDCENFSFEEYVENFGFVTAYGTFSDISVICPAWKVAGVNLSIGYRNEHSYSEVLYVGNMIDTIQKVGRMLQDAENAAAYEYIPASYTKYYSTKYSKAWGLDDYIDEFGWDPSYGVSKETWKAWHTKCDLICCNRCGEKDYDYNMFPVKDTDGSTIYLCPECVGKETKMNWCQVCAEAFIVKDEDSVEDAIICYDCIEEGYYNDNRNSKDSKTV